MDSTGEDDPLLWDNFHLGRELLSSLTPDFTTLLYNGKLDKQAMQDCAAYLNAVVGRKRDRSVNMWGMLLYYMVNINFMAQSSAEDMDEIFEWMIKSVTRSTYELTNHQGVLDQVLISIHKVLTTHPSPLGGKKDDELIFWHNYRTTCSPFADVFVNPTAPRFYAFRMDLVLDVIKNVLNKVFNIQEVMRAVEVCNWAKVGKCYFYDATLCSWPIAAQIPANDDSHTHTMVPLAEDDLCAENTAQYKAIFFQQVRFDNLIETFEAGGRVDVDYKSVVIKSSNRDQNWLPEYNFYEFVTGTDERGWYGYRALAQCSFNKYCGALNQMFVDSPSCDHEINIHVVQANVDAGFGTLGDLYMPHTLLEHYGYNFPDPDRLAPAYNMIPFGMRNDDAGDLFVDYHNPPWRTFWHGKGGMGEDVEYEVHAFANLTPLSSPSPSQLSTPKNFSPSSLFNVREDNEQSTGVGGPSPNRRHPGSSPLKDSTKRLENSPHGPSSERPLKRQRADPSASLPTAEGEDDEEQVPEMDEAAMDAECAELEGMLPDLDEPDWEEFLHTQPGYVPGQCTQVVHTHADGRQVICGAECNPAEQLCHYCRTQGHYMTGLL